MVCLSLLTNERKQTRVGVGGYDKNKYFLLSSICVCVTIVYMSTRRSTIKKLGDLVHVRLHN
jgi:hypothetical protein